MRIQLEYGQTGLWVEVPDRNLAGVLGLRPVRPVSDPVAAVEQALAAPIGALPLAQLAGGRRDACVVVCDITRPAPNAVLLPPLLRALAEGGIPQERITILIATGIHRPNEGAELEMVLGREIPARYRVVNHNARDLSSHRLVGVAGDGTPIYVDARYCGAELKVIVGLVEPHFMAGFSGGRKLICPGISALETVRTFHSTALLEHPCAETGVVAGNPVHAMALEVARAAGVDFSLNVVIDEERRITGVFAGELEASWEAGVAHVRQVATATVPEPVEIVVTSAAGYPLDATYYQAVKGMVGALPIVRPGGTIILAARMSEGLGSPEFARLLLESESLSALMARIRDPDHFVVDQWEVVELAKALARAEVLCFSEGVDPDTLRRAYVTPIASVEAGFAEALERHGADARIAVIPKGPYVMPRVHGAA